MWEKDQTPNCHKEYRTTPFICHRNAWAADHGRGVLDSTPRRTEDKRDLCQQRNGHAHGWSHPEPVLLLQHREWQRPCCRARPLLGEPLLAELLLLELLPLA